MDTPEEQNEMGRIMSRDAAIKERTVPLEEKMDALFYIVKKHQEVLDYVLVALQEMKDARGQGGNVVGDNG